MKRAFVEQPLVTAAARSTSGTSNTANVSRTDFVSLIFLVTAISGTNAKIGFQVDYSSDDTNWNLAKDIVRTAVTGTLIARVPVFAKYLRVRWTIRGTTPSVTFRVDLSWREE